MPNPNNNKHFNDEALRINRALKRENDKLKNILNELDTFLIQCKIETTEDDREVGRLQELIRENT